MSTLSGSCLSTLCEDVQFNCAISDARYARDYSLCIYLLRMREYYRWRFDIPLMQQLDTDVVGSWISEMEAHWDDIEESSFKPLIVNGNAYDPLDSEAINKQLIRFGLVYSAGVGRMGQPHFLLAELKNSESSANVVSYECGKELALTQNQTIFIRHDSITRHIWLMLDEWRLQKKEGPLSRVVKHFSLDTADQFDIHLERAAAQFLPLYREHERGEVAAGELLGERFNDTLQRTLGTQNEFYLRAVRDLVADSLYTWPFMLARRSEILLDFWLAGLAGARKELLSFTHFMRQLQEEGCNGDRFDQLGSEIEIEQKRWASIAQQLLAHCESNPNDANVKSQAHALLQKS